MPVVADLVALGMALLLDRLDLVTLSVMAVATLEPLTSGLPCSLVGVKHVGPEAPSLVVVPVGIPLPSEIDHDFLVVVQVGVVVAECRHRHSGFLEICREVRINLDNIS